MSSGVGALIRWNSGVLAFSGSVFCHWTFAREIYILNLIPRGLKTRLVRKIFDF